MTAEDHNEERSSTRGVPGGVDRSLDTIARGLADGTLSRRKALRLMGAALVGSTLVAAIPGLAVAKPKPGKCNKDKHCPSGQQCVNRTCQGGLGETPTNEELCQQFYGPDFLGVVCQTDADCPVVPGTEVQARCLSPHFGAGFGCCIVP